MTRQGGPSTTVQTALDQAQVMADTGVGLVVVLHRGDQLAAVLHWRPGGEIAVGPAAASLGADTAILIVVGSTRRIAQVIGAADVAHEQLTAEEVDVIAAVHVHAIESGAAVRHLSATTMAPDFIATPPASNVSARTAWFWRWKPA